MTQPKPSAARSGRLAQYLGRKRRSNDYRAKNKRTRRVQLGRSLEQLESRRLLAFSTGVLEDINLLGLSANPDSLTEVAGDVYFLADDGVSGLELYRTDGTTGQTDQVIDLFPGDFGSAIEQLTPVGNDLYFVGTDDGGDNDLWRTDGTEAGTVKLIDSSETDIYAIYELTESGGKLFFTAYEGSTGYELWSSDGTVAGTAIVKDINSDPYGGEGPTELTDVNGTLFFTTFEDGIDNRELWKSDGTDAGTVMVADLDGDPYESSYPEGLGASGSLLYFSADIGDGFELFVSDGTAGGTFQVADLNPGSDSSYPSDFIPFNGGTVFIADDGTGRKLYSTDGSTVTPLPDPTGGAFPLDPSELTVFNGDLYFAANGGTVLGTAIAAAPELTDGNTFRISDTRVAGVSEFKQTADRGFVRLSDANGQRYDPLGLGGDDDGPGFVSATAQIGTPGVGLTSIEVGDLIIAGATNVVDLQDPTYSWVIEDPAGLTDISFDGFASGNEFNSATEGLIFELFLNDDTVASETLSVAGDELDNFFGTRNSGNLAISNPGGITVTKATVRMSFGVNGVVNNITPNDRTTANPEAVVVRATLTGQGQTSGSAGRELHVYDGSSISLVADLVPNASSNPTELTVAGGSLFFTANNPLDGTGRELYVSDGTEAGTAIVTDIRPGVDLGGTPLSSNPTDLTAASGQLFFSATDVNGDNELWSSDGTAGGTSQVANLNDATESSDPEQFNVVGSVVYFVANDGVNGEAIYMADPAAGTVDLVFDATPSSFDQIFGLTVLPNGSLLFGHDSLGVFSYSGGSATQLTPFVPSADAEGQVFEILGSNAYFSAGTPIVNGGAQGIELWRTGGTIGTTAVVSDVNPGVLGSGPTFLTAHAGEIYFSAEAGDGRELYRTNGGVGFVLVDDIAVANFGNSSDDSDPRELTSVGSNLFFVARADGDSDELYVTTGNGATVLAETPGNGGSAPQDLMNIDGTLFYSSTGNTPTGRELYTSDGTEAGTTLLFDLAPGNDSSIPEGLTQVGSDLYFSAFTPATGRELYLSDGTLAGTSVVQDLQAGAASSNPQVLGAIPDGRVFLSAIESGTTNRELFIAGGSINGILPVADINVGESPSDPSNVIRVGSTTLFVATDTTYGRELRILEETAPTVVSTVVNDGADQRSNIGSVTVTFDSVVTVGTDAFVVENSTTAQPVDVAVVLDEIDNQTVATITFLEGASVNSAGLLEDGTYQLTIDSTRVSGLGTPLDGDADGSSGGDYVFGAEPADDFFRKYGDINGDNSVGLLDFGAFRGQFGMVSTDPGFDFGFDSNGDGDIGLEDFGAFRGNFGT